MLAYGRKAFSVGVIMKVMLATFLAIMVLLVSCGPSGGTSADQSRMSVDGVWLGMSQEQLKAVHANVVSDAANSDRLMRPETMLGISGKWIYYFKDAKLTWYMFNAVEQQLSKSRFDDFLLASDGLMNGYQDKLGKPRKVRQGIKDYRDPARQPHNGYLVQQAFWESKAGKYQVEFSFLGEHSNYSLMLNIQVKE